MPEIHHLDRAATLYCSPRTNSQAGEGTIVIECDRANGNNRSCCHRDVLSPASLLACVPLAYSFSFSLPRLFICRPNVLDLNFWVGPEHVGLPAQQILSTMGSTLLLITCFPTMGTLPRYCLQWDGPLLVSGDMLSYNTLPTRPRPPPIKKP